MELDDVSRWHIGNLALRMFGKLTAHTLQCAEMAYRTRRVPLWSLTRLAMQEKATGRLPDADSTVRTYHVLYHMFE